MRYRRRQLGSARNTRDRPTVVVGSLSSQKGFTRWSAIFPRSRSSGSTGWDEIAEELISFSITVSCLAAHRRFGTMNKTLRLHSLRLAIIRRKWPRRWMHQRETEREKGGEQRMIYLSQGRHQSLILQVQLKSARKKYTEKCRMFLCRRNSRNY